MVLLAPPLTRRALLVFERTGMNIENGLPAGFNPDNYDAIVVGAGYAGAVCARRLAESCGFKVAIVERRDHEELLRQKGMSYQLYHGMFELS